MPENTYRSSGGDFHAHEYFRLFREGNQKGMNYIYNLLYNTVFSCARTIISDEFEIMTIIQDAFNLIWNRRSMMENIEHIKNYLCKRVKWDCLTYSVKGKNRPLSLESFQEQGISLAIFDPQEEAAHRERQLTDEENLDLIWKAQEYLRPKEGKLIKLMLECYSYAEIVTITGYTRQFINREEKRLIKKLSPYIERLKKASQQANYQYASNIAYYEKFLTPLQIMIMKLYYEKGYTFHQISEELNITITKVMKEYLAAEQCIRDARKH